MQTQTLCDQHRQPLADSMDAYSKTLDQQASAVADQMVRFARIREASQEIMSAAEAVLSDIDALIAESEGVYGLHGNGDLAPWDELTEGGPYEEWLISLETLRAAIAKAKGGSHAG